MPKNESFVEKKAWKQFFENCVGGKFFEDFSWVFPRSTHQDASIEQLFEKFCSVGASEEKFPSN